ncbi:MAG: PqqD family protein, partial [bacterium]|nr:PqqD family protein [bacterium]
MLFKKQPKISREAMFNSKPTRNDLLEWEKKENGETAITLRRADTLKVKIISKLFWVPEKRTLVLDEIGSQIWGMCDGRTTVQAMVNRLSEDHQLNAKEAEISLLAYLKKLGQKNL